MTLQEYLLASQVDASLPRPVMEALGEAVPKDLTDTLSQHRPAMRLNSFESLTELVFTRHRWMKWQQRRAKCPDVASDLLDQTFTADEVSAMGRAAVFEEATRDAVFATWKELRTIARATSTVVVALTNEKHPRAPQYKKLEGNAGPAAEIDGAVWLEIRRGIRGGVVAVSFEHDVSALTPCLADHEAALADAFAGKTAEAWLTEAVLPHLSEALEAYTNDRVEEAALRISAKTYETLLLSEPLKTAPIGALFVGTDRQRVGMAVVDKRGKVTASAPIRPSAGWTDRAARWMKDHRAKAIALPETAPAAHWLAEANTVFADSTARIVPVNVSGVIAARSIDDPSLKRVSPEEASAIVLARRAWRPIEAWVQVKPEQLGLAPMQVEMNQDRLREVLQMIRERAIADNAPLSTAPVNTGGLRGRSNAPLNPNVNTIRDLTPGMQLNGIVTNVTKFGAFVNLGIRQEGLVHISELSDEFVNDPHEVAQAGQRVSARVISIDTDRGRIALSMKTEMGLRTPGGGGGFDRRQDSRPSGGPRPQRSGPQGAADRNRALADLESLFKK